MFNELCWLKNHKMVQNLGNLKKKIVVFFPFCIYIQAQNRAMSGGLMCFCGP